MTCNNHRESFRIFMENGSNRPSDDDSYQKIANFPLTIMMAYTDGSCQKNELINAMAGASI